MYAYSVPFPARTQGRNANEETVFSTIKRGKRKVLVRVGSLKLDPTLIFSPLTKIR
jgi:hypothetical protein